MTKIKPTLIINTMIDEIEEDYTLEFKKEYGIIDMIEIGRDFGGYMTYQIIFDSEDNKTNYIETFDIPID